MKFTWHIIKKDLLRDRWALLVWGLLFVGHAGLGWVMLHLKDFDLSQMNYVQLAAGVLVFLQVVMGYILVTRLVHADGLVGTNMFWLTRPVSAARMFTAKALGALLIFGLFPVLLLVPWWLYCHFGWREIGWTALEMAGWQLLMIAPAFAVASLTDDLGRVLLWTLLLAIGLMSWVVLLHASFTTVLGSSVGVGGVDLIYSRLWLAGVTLIVGSAVIAAHQYLTRRFVRSVVLAAAGLGLIALIGEFVPWKLAGGIRQLPERALPLAPAEMVEPVTFEVLPGHDMTPPNPRDKPTAPVLDTPLNLHMRVLGLPDGLQLGVERVSHTWTWPNGINITRRSIYYGGFDFDYPSLRRQFSLPVLAEDPETVRWTKTKRAEMDARRAYRRKSSPEEPQGRILTATVSLPNSFVDKMRHDPPAYAASFQGILYRMDTMAELALTPGASAAGEAYTFQVQRVRAGQPLVLITQPTFPQSGLWNSGGYVRGDEGNGRTVAQPIALNFVTGDISWVGCNQTGSKSLAVAGVALNWNIMQIGSRLVIRDGKSVGLAAIDPRWLEHTKLVVLSPNQIGSFNREVKAENYSVTDYWDIIDGGRKADGKP